jgi:hypothetical protein
MMPHVSPENQTTIFNDMKSYVNLINAEDFADLVDLSDVGQFVFG